MQDPSLMMMVILSFRSVYSFIELHTVYSARVSKGSGLTEIDAD